MTETKTNLKTELISLINSLDYLTPIQKNEWLQICETLNQEKLLSLYEKFSAEKADEENFKFSLIYRTSLGDLYKSKIKQISTRYMATVRKKSEAYTTQTDEQPENILSKLNDV